MKLPFIPRLLIFLSIVGLVAEIVLSQSTTDIREKAQAPDRTASERISTRDFQKDSIRDIKLPMLEVTLFYPDAQHPDFSLISTTIKTSFEQKFRGDKTKSFQLTLLDAKNHQVSSTRFVVPTHVDGPPPLNPEEVSPDSVTLQQSSLVVNVPWRENGYKIQVSNNAGKVVMSAQLANVQVLPNSNNYLSTPAEPTTPVPENFFSQIVNVFLAPPPADYLDIVFVSDGFVTPADFDLFHQDVTQMTNHLLTYEPFTSKASRLRFTMIDNTTNLNCTYYDRLILCDSALTFQQVNTAGVPYDKVVVVHNGATYGGSGGDIAVDYNGTYMSPVFVHELGHTLAGLEDEYVKQTVADDGTAFVRPNCFRGTPPNPAWQGLVGPSEYYIGCNFAEWYRPSENSIMKEILAQYFNTVSQKALSDAIDFYSSDAIPEPTPVPGVITACNADIDQNGVVNLSDYSLLAFNFLRSPFPTPRADIDQNGKVNLSDYLYLSKFFLKTCT